MLATRARERGALLAAGLREGRDFVAIDAEPPRVPRGGVLGSAGELLSHRDFEQRLWAELGPRIAAREFDVVNRLTPRSAAIPSLIAGPCAAAGARFVWGPIGDGPSLEAPLGGRIGVALAALAPGFRATRQHASALLVGSQASWEQMPARYLDRCVYLPASAIGLDRLPQRTRTQLVAPLRIACAGGADLAVEAAAPLVGADAVRLDLLEGAASPERLAAADVLVAAAPDRSAGGAVLAAMALGVVPIVLDAGAARELVSAQTGYRVPIGPRPALIRALRELLTRLAARPESLAPRGAAARERVRALYTWRAMAERTHAVYGWTLGRGDKPHADHQHDALPDFAALDEGLSVRPAP